MQRAQSNQPTVLGRYAIYGEIASGGMATVHFGRLIASGGFSRTVAIKRLHAQFAKDPAFVSMLLDEARLTSRIRQANVVPVLDVEARDGELLLVMDYVQGESLSRLRRAAASRKEPIPLDIVSAIVAGTLYGLHAAHEAKSEAGEPLNLVHRDVSPQNVLVGVDGVARLIDFGIAKASDRIHVTRDGQLKGKLPYMAPEQILRRPVDRRADIYSASVMLWLLLTGKLPFDGPEASLLYEILHREVPAPSEIVRAIPPELDLVVARGMAREPDHRYETALEMAEALEQAAPPATAREVAEWVERTAAAELVERAARVAEIESGSALPADATPSGVAAGKKDEETTTVVRDKAGASQAISAMTSPSVARPARKAWGVAIVATLAALGSAAYALRPPTDSPSVVAAGVDRAAAPLVSAAAVPVAPEAPAESASAATPGVPAESAPARGPRPASLPARRPRPAGASKGGASDPDAKYGF